MRPEICWYVKPLDYLRFVFYEPATKRRGVDWLGALANQGFLALQGVGGCATMTRDSELIHHTMVYAPGTNGADEAPDFELAARMLDFPSGDLEPHDWVPSGVYGHLALRWKMQDAFWFSKSLVNEIVGEVVFDEVLKSIAFDPSGPRIDIQKELIRHLGERVTMLFHHRTPREHEGDLWIYAIELKDTATVRRTIDRAMEHDPAAAKRILGEHVIWAIAADLDEEEFIPNTNNGVPGLGPLGFDEDEDNEEEKEFSWTGAISVAHGHLFIASHPDFLIGLLDKPKKRRSLTTTNDYQQIIDALRDDAESPTSWQWFARTHFGPGGIVVRAKRDGWLVSGCLVEKPN